jgi:N-acyl-L-homoserine lactone synthetase
VFGEMMCACGEFGRRMGISEYYLVTHPRVIRSIQANGCQVRLLGPSRGIGRCIVNAAAVAVSDEAVATLRRTYSLPPKVLRIAGEAAEAAAPAAPDTAWASIAGIPSLVAGAQARPVAL